MNTTCLRCRRTVEVPDEDSGELTRCPACRKQFIASPVGSVVFVKQPIDLTALAWAGSAMGMGIAVYYLLFYSSFAHDSFFALHNRGVCVEFGLGLCIVSTLIALFKRH